MRWVQKLCLRLRALFRRGAVEDELETELQFHLERQTAMYLGAGLAPAEARRAAAREFGGIEALREQCRDARGTGAVRDFARDLRYALRLVRRSPGFAAITVLCLGLGIGANSAMFNAANALLLRPLPVWDPGRIAVLAFRQGPGPLTDQFSLPDLRDIRSQGAGVFSGVLGYTDVFDGLARRGKAQRVLTNYVTGNYFALLGIQPYLGRLILPSDGRLAGAGAVVVLSFSYWKSALGADRNIVGQTMQLNGHPVKVIGIAPPGFDGLSTLASVQAYLPFSMLTTLEAGWPADLMINRALQNLHTFVRLLPGISIARAAAVLHTIASRLATAYPATDRGLALSLYPERLARPSPEASQGLIRAAVLLLVLVILVLLLVCINLAHLLLVRAEAREPEIALRAALGAGRGRLVRQSLAESALLAVLGGVAGLILGMWGSRVLASLNLHEAVPVHVEFGMDWRTACYWLAAVLLAGLCIGMWPALRAGHMRGQQALRQCNPRLAARASRLRHGLVIVQIAGSLMLLVIAALFSESLVNLRHANLGFDPNQLVNLTMDPTELGYGPSRGAVFYQSLLQQIAALPGVQSAALSSSIPMSDYYNNDYVRIQDYQHPPGAGLPLVSYSVVSPDYFRTLRIPRWRGRTFTAADRAGSRYVAVVNEAFARRYWPGRDPIGERFTKVSGSTNPFYQVVGVVHDSRIAGLRGPYEPYFYLPLAQNYNLSSLEVLQIRSAAPPAVVIRQSESVVRRLAPGLPIFNVETMQASLQSVSAFLPFEFGAAVAAGLALFSLLIAVLGIYGATSYAVSCRRQEIGLRMALGAAPVQVLKLILGQGLCLIGAGVVLGCAGALAGARLFAHFLVGVSATNPLIYALVSAILAASALLACWVPAWRVMRIHPAEALRRE